ncbi:MAG: helicase C-terminal domain-containing protein [Nitrospirota bacterium]
MNELVSAFNVLKKRFPNYEDRPQQLEMAGEVFGCLKDKKNLIVEAGTGVGKSFAYLIPAILSNKKTVVSTATIALQDQLVNNDLLFLQKALDHKFSFAILKGKNNYLCLKREREFAELGESYKKFSEWVSDTKTGDKDELSFIPDFWARLCGDSDDCNVRECPFFNDCFYYRHYRQLHKKDILVVNHYLLIYDVLSDFSLLPFHEQLIIDEAHKIEDIISHVFGSALSHSRMVWFLYRLRGLKIAVDHLFGPVDSFFKRMDLPSQSIYPIPEDIIEGLRNLKRLLALDKAVFRLNAYKGSAASNELKDKIETTISYIKSLARDIDDFIQQDDDDKVYYVGGNKNAIELKSNLVEVQKPFNYLLNGYDSLIMTSATLTSGGGFSFIKERLGIADPQSGSGTSPVRSLQTKGEKVTGNFEILNERTSNGASFREKVIGSPFNYKKQALLYIDKTLPLPNKEKGEAFQQESIKTIEGLINASRGRALVLFTSYKHLDFVSRNIRIGYPFKSQGDMPSARLVNWFKKTENSVLLATATFWQGIDIKGERLSLVVIVKMPFGSPGEPVYDERCRRLGERWFSDLALPSAILLLRQGFGRLIRGLDDYGVVAVLDTRLITSSYGKIIISSLPKMDITHSIEEVKKFFNSIPQPVPPPIDTLKGRPKGPQTLAAAKSYKICNDDTKLVPDPDRGKDNPISQIVALGNSNDPSAIPELKDFTRSKNGNERRLAASALGRLAKFKPEIYKAVEALEPVIRG